MVGVSSIVNVSSLVALFEHVHGSGVPNFKLCRIPVVNSKLKISVWREKLVDYSDNIVCEYLEYGFPLDYNRNKKLNYDDSGRNHKGARDFPEFISQYFERECNASRVIGPFEKNPFSVPLVTSPLNSVPKPGEQDRRVIVDLSWPIGNSVNDGISKDFYLDEPIELRYTSVEEVCNMVLLMGKGAVIYKRDLRRAYRQIPVDPRDYRYLGYRWNGQWMVDTVLAMGQRNAAMACSRTTEAVMYLHSEEGYFGTSYLDDLIGVSIPEKGAEAYNSLGRVLEELGLEENKAKACPPSTVQVVLGVEINTSELTVSIKSERLIELKELCVVWERKRKSTKRELQSLVGKLCFVVKCVRQSRVFLNRMLHTLRSMSIHQKSVSLSTSFKKDLRWWKKYVERFNGVSFIPPIVWSKPDFFFSTDSYLTGCGGICENEYFHARYPDFIMEQNLRIHQLELLAVLVGVRLWGYRYPGMKIQIFCDNDAAVTVINSSRTTDQFMGSCLRELWLEVCNYKFELRAVHLPGEENRLADWLSRWDLHESYSVKFKEYLNESDNNKFIKEALMSPALFMFCGNL